MCPMYPWMLEGNAGGLGMMIGMLLWGLVGLALLVLIVVVIVRVVSGRPPEFLSSQPPRGPDARSILDERYARGEIDDEEYQRRLKTLSS